VFVRRLPILGATFVALAFAGCGQPRISPSITSDLPDKPIDSVVLTTNEVLNFDWFGYGQWGSDPTKNAHVVGGSVVGYVEGRLTTISVADIEEIVYRRPAYIGTILLTAMLVGVVVVWASIYCCFSSSH